MINKCSNKLLYKHRDEDITTNDENVNRNVDSLRPNSADSPATTSVDDFKVTVTFPEYGIPIDKIRLPIRDNIQAVKVFVYRPGKDRPMPLNFDKVC